MSSRVKSFLGISFLLGALELGACGNASFGEQPVVSGQITNWRSGSGFSVSVFALTGGSGAAKFTEAPIDASGHFSITLPSAAALAPYLIHRHVDSAQATPLFLFSGGQTPLCQASNLQSDQSDFGSLAIFLKSFHSDGGSDLNVVPMVPSMPISDTLTTYVYVDRDVNESGTVNCITGTTTASETIDVHFGKGWNLQSDTRVTGNSYSTITLPLDTPLTWLSTT